MTPIYVIVKTMETVLRYRAATVPWAPSTMNAQYLGWKGL